MFSSSHHHEEGKDHEFQGVLDHDPPLLHHHHPHHHHQDTLQLHDVPQFDPDEDPPPSDHHHHHHHLHHLQLRVLQEEEEEDHDDHDFSRSHHDDSLHHNSHHHHQHVSDLDHEDDPLEHHRHDPSSPPPIPDPSLPTAYGPPLEDPEEEEEDEDLGRDKCRKRRRYDNDFKARVLEQLKIPGSKLSEVSRMFEVPENTVREWTKLPVEQLIEAARHKQCGSLKANAYDPLNRLHESVAVYFERNAQEQDHLKQPITTKLIVSKGLETRNNLLELNEIQPFLDPKEKKAFQKFMGSDSWAKRFAKRYNLKMSGTRVKDIGDDEVRNYVAQLRQVAGRVKQGGPGYDEAAVLILQAAEKLVSARIMAARRMGQSAAQIMI